MLIAYTQPCPKKHPRRVPPDRYELYRNNLIDLLQSKRKHPPPLEIKMDTDGRVYVEGGLVVDITDAQSLGQAFSLVSEREGGVFTREGGE